jgi:hypothetical protein
MDYLDFLDWNSQFLADENELRIGGIAVLGEFFAQKFNFTFVESSFDSVDIFGRRCKLVRCGWTFHEACVDLSI